MKLITIENKGWGSLIVHEGKLPRARLEWYVKGDGIEIYIKGHATDCYDLMAVTAISEAIKAGFKSSDLRCVNPTKIRSNFKTETRKLL